MSLDKGLVVEKFHLCLKRALPSLTFLPVTELLTGTFISFTAQRPPCYSIFAIHVTDKHCCHVTHTLHQWPLLFHQNHNPYLDPPRLS